MIIFEKNLAFGFLRPPTLAVGLPKPNKVQTPKQTPKPPERIIDPKKLAVRSRFLDAGGAKPTEVEFERLLGTNDLVDEFYLERALLAAHPVCRISIRAQSGHERGCATGFMVSPRLLLTNHHVFASADEAAPSIAEFNYRFDIAGRPDRSYRFKLRPDQFFFNDPEFDFALVAVETASLEDQTPLNRFGYHRLIATSGKALKGEWMTIIQHPGGARRQFSIRENECTGDQEPAEIWYKSDTAQGSSGSPVFNDSFQVVALHHTGVPRQDPVTKRYYLKNGKTVKSIDGLDDSQIDWYANAGIRVSCLCARIKERAVEKNGCLNELMNAMQGHDVLSNAYESSQSGIDMSNTSNNGGRLVLGTLVLELGNAFLANQPLAIGSSTVPALDQSGDAQETYKEPIVDTNYTNRKGFDTKFLGIETPHPKIEDASVIAPMKDGGKIIPYEHFSVVLHKKRKLAIYTAWNVDASSKAKRPEAGKDYSRKSLTGLDKELEKWVIDPRVDAAYQIPDAFYTKDNGAFDKGHIARREDVCFGTSFKQIQRANGDSFHVTNCSPQRGNYNQSGKHGIWGELENFIGAQADTERFSIFAGPVLSSKDKTFDGTERVMIPDRFWKVVCAVKNKKLQVFAFVLEQYLTDLPLEFQVDAKWKHKQVSLKKLEGIIKLITFPKVYHDGDQGK